METAIPETSAVLGSLLKADFTTQWRNRRAVVLTLLVPLLILVGWKSIIKYTGGAFVLSNSIAIGLFATGLMGYANTIARDRDKGIFQRLRVAPLPSWAILFSRLFVQVTMILVVTTTVFIVGFQFDGIALSPGAYIITYFTALVGGSVSLGLGQAIVGYIKNPETVNSATRLFYIGFIVLGMIGEAYMKSLDKIDKNDRIWVQLIQFSPYGTVKTILSDGMDPSKWSANTTTALLVTLGYTLIFTVLGIKWFKWNTK